MKLLPKIKARGKNHLIFVVGAAMSFGLIYLFVAPKLVKPAPAPVVAARGHGGIRDDAFMAMRGHGGHRDEGFLAHAYAVRDTSISDVHPGYSMRISGGV